MADHAPPPVQPVPDATRTRTGGTQPEEPYAIEHGMPIPAKRYRQRYNFKSMKVGDSFSAKREEEGRVRAAASYWGRYHGGRFTVARMPGIGIRCWRIA